MKANNQYEIQLNKDYNKIVGLDEVGCGSLTSDLYVAGVIFPSDIDYKNLLPDLNDSKQLTEEQRIILYDKIKQHASFYHVEKVSQKEIEDLNVYWAKFEGFKRVVDKLNPDFILIDGNHKIKNISIPQEAIIKGDAKSISIASASILAKVERDKYMVELSKEYPMYGWDKNKGYYTQEHLKAIQKYGRTKYHRSNFLANIT